MEREKDKEGNFLGSRKNDDDNAEYQPRRKKTGKEMIKSFMEHGMEDPVVNQRLQSLTVSPLAAHKNPRSWFENLANIMTVAFGKKWGSPAVLQKYQDWIREDYPLEEISEYLDRATRNIRGGGRIRGESRIREPEKQKQTLISQYFAYKSKPDKVTANSVDLENNQSKV